MNKKIVILLLFSFCSGTSYAAEFESKDQAVKEKETSEKIDKIITLIKKNLNKKNIDFFEILIKKLKEEAETDKDFTATCALFLKEVLLKGTLDHLKILLNNNFNISQIVKIKDHKYGLPTLKVEGSLFPLTNHYGNQEFINYLLDENIVNPKNTNLTIILTEKNIQQGKMSFLDILSGKLKHSDLTYREGINLINKMIKKEFLIKNQITTMKNIKKNFIESVQLPLYSFILQGAPLELIRLIIDDKNINSSILQEYKPTTKAVEETSALYTAIHANQQNIIEFLLTKNADPNKGVTNHQQLVYPPIYLATQLRQIDTIRLLLDHNVNINVFATSDGIRKASPREVAFYLDFPEIIKLFDEYENKIKSPKERLSDEELIKLFKDGIKQKEKEIESKPKLTKKQKEKKKKEKKREQEKALAEESETIIIEEKKGSSRSSLKKGPIALKRRVTDWFTNPQRALKVQGYLEDSPQPDPFKRALYNVVGERKIITHHRFPRAIDATVLYDDNYGKIEDRKDGTYIIRVPGHIKEGTNITFGQFEYVFYIKENGTRVILHRFFRELTISELEKEFKPSHGWGNMNSVASLEVQRSTEETAGPADSKEKTWQSEFEKEGWTHQDNEEMNTRLFIHPDIKTEYGIKKQEK